LGPAIFVGGWAIQQLWLFWIAPILGGVLAGFFYSKVMEVPKKERQLSEMV
jgi:aquaporin Z